MLHRLLVLGAFFYSFSSVASEHCQNLSGLYVSMGCMDTYTVKIVQAGCDKVTFTFTTNNRTATNELITDGQFKRYNYPDGSGYSLQLSNFTAQGLMNLFIYYDNRHDLPPSLSYWNLESNGNITFKTSDYSCQWIKKQ